ncbi:ectonucleotide pyrophosphatase/phosphodiesterase family member 5 [Elysia marginata]|uniref:Ectonucleotide pyrophosphatase/phosphodiesterase family member 5 n=1 Tax=Elysia marginata TaxID=1093978 RepID=A0AAV4FQJ0_9GAST|nr:ectonucleotide pyrophosphatase/phosphodiesterase family member 5 [Elysia marginata]
MIAAGVTMPYVNNSFITDTFPSHYTIATGLFTESHGIIGNHMYDPVFDSTFHKTNVEPRWWEGGEPIWITATKAGLKAGVYYWPGSNVRIYGTLPAAWYHYSEAVPFEDRVRTMIQWLSRDDFDLALMYFPEPDGSGHELGPEHPGMLPVIARMDKLLGFLLEEMKAAGLLDKTNFIVTSDHGMTTLDLNNKVVNISHYVNGSLLHTMVDQGTTAQMRPQPGKARDLVQALAGIENIHVMLKEDIPDRFHLKASRRVMDVFAYADEGSIMTTDPSTLSKRGDHGYDNALNMMKPLFIARGPAFKQGVSVDPILNVDIYPLICHLLDIEPAANNGSMTRVKSLLSDESGHGTAARNSWSHHVGVVLSAVTCIYLSIAV